MVMVYVPDGEFEMGSTEGRGDEMPAHTVALDGFWIGQTEVTNAQYALCVADGACRESDHADDATYNGDDYPVVGVSWQDGADYCTWAGGRLPTEAEWEYAARGTDGRIYPWGNDEPTCERAQFWECSDGTVPVGSLLDGASWCGALDMTGNVWEWVADWYGRYPSETQTNPTGPATGYEKVMRGGAWNSYWTIVHAANRFCFAPDVRTVKMGFRCVSP
jgi:serine/threonine-protein kinase